MQPLFVLIPSPLCGPFTWAAVADELRRRGREAVTPALEDAGDNRAAPYWQQHAQAVRRVLAAVAAERPVALVGHSGAGPLLPVIGQTLGRPVAAYVFADAGLPLAGASRLEARAVEAPTAAARFYRLLATGARFPAWSDADLGEIVPDPAVRRAVLAELRPRALSFWQERLPVPVDWPDAPCAYLQLSPGYDAPAAQARQLGWAYGKIDAGHFHMLVDPVGVTEAILTLVG
jgi:hypothetical protein